LARRRRDASASVKVLCTECYFYISQADAMDNL